MTEPELPRRFERLARLGRGGGGEVWSVRDRHTGAVYALKALADDATESERAALVREAVALSGLEGLGVPRVMGFGRLPASGRAYMVRELVDGQSLDSHLEQGSNLTALIASLAGAADQLTVLHRAGLLHGDVKPANVIIEPDGTARLVDLGLAAPWRDGGTKAEGLTPRYAAPELLEGEVLTVRAEVYALGATLGEILERGGGASAGDGVDAKMTKVLRAVVSRAVATAPERRFPSADEFATALRHAAGLPPPSEDNGSLAMWPIVGIEATSARLLTASQKLRAGRVLRLVGPAGSGKSSLLRRLAWSLGVEGEAHVWIEDTALGARAALESELAEFVDLENLLILVDDVDALEPSCMNELERARQAGARLVLVGGEAFREGAEVFDIPPLDESLATDLIRRTIPSLNERLAKRIIEATACWPGELKRLLRRIGASTVLSDADVERALGTSEVPEALPMDPLDRAVHFLDRGRYTEASEALSRVTANPHEDLRLNVALGRYDLGIGETARAKGRLLEAEPLLAAAAPALAHEWTLALARALTGVGDYAEALKLLTSLSLQRGAVGAEALAYQGYALALVGKEEEAQSVLDTAVKRAERAKNVRVLAVALACQGLVFQRSDRSTEALGAYRRAIANAEEAPDAGLLAMLELNMAGQLKVSGDIAGAIVHFEAAVDMGRRSGRRSTLRQALLNLANTDLYLGRLARVHSTLDVLGEQKGSLSPIHEAQVLGLGAELAARSGRFEEAFSAFGACARAYDALGRGVDAAEARLEGVLSAARGGLTDAAALRGELRSAEDALAGVAAHRPLHLVARARVAMLAGNEPEAHALVDDAIVVAREAQQKDWVWRALDIRADLCEAAGQPLTARRDREEALAVLEAIGGRLPRDLREVYWNDPPRRRLRSLVYGSALRRDDPAGTGLGGSKLGGRSRSRVSSTISSLTRTPLEQKLARLLEINSELVGELDINRLCASITDHAVALLNAERGFVVLRDKKGALSVHTSRTREGDALHAEFSRSIAERVIASGQPTVSLDAREDSRFSGYSSVHQMMLQSVACAPIRARGGEIVGALYLETRGAPGAHFEAELPTLLALSDQVAIALENARLIQENRERAEELARKNAELAEAELHLRELLGDRTASLERTRQKLRTVRETLLSHFGYKGLVGTSDAMRRVYALIERIKDTDVPVLITGESGTGKEMVVRAIHSASPFAAEPLLAINCAAVPEQLLESELFGHVRGAFTGADKQRRGLFQECGKGSVMLDEIAEMSKRMQTSVLRVLQERTVKPVGSNTEEPFLGRIFCATNKNLEQAVASGEFREDLYYRIHVVEVHLPPLRERAEDIPQLVDHFLGIFSARYKRPKKTISASAQRALSRYAWPGNVRQLEHVLLNAWVLSDKAELDAGDLDLPSQTSQPARPNTPREGDRASAHRSHHGASEHRGEQRSKQTLSGKTTRSATASQHRGKEKERIVKALRESGWNRARAAILLGMPRRTFYRRLKDFGLQ